MTRAKLLLAVCLLLASSAAASAQVCDGPEDCDDGIFCNGQETCGVLDLCEPGLPPEGQPCDDGLFCNGTETCTAGACGTSTGDPCAANGECNDACDEAEDSCADPQGTLCTDEGNGCTDDVCNGMGACAHPDNTASCDDGAFCNGADTCAGGACDDHAGNPCTGNGECDDSCDEGADSCASPAGDPCTADTNDCTSDVCNGMGSCAHPPNTAPCDDGVFCNGMDTCAAGACGLHEGDPCAANGECNDACDEGAGSCADASGTPCTDEGNDCTNDVCNGMGACGHPPNAASCDDGVFCNGMDTCAAGSCSSHAGNPCAGGAECADQCNEGTTDCFVPAATACASDGNPCTTDECNGMGACAHPADTGATCDDGFFCNGMDTCSSAGTCVHPGDPCAGGVVCQNACNETANNCLAIPGTLCPDDGNQCTDDRCNVAGSCQHSQRVNGFACNDGLFCTATDSCAAGTCVGSGDPCAAGAECAASCNEGADNCFAGAVVACTDDGNLCTDDLCNGMGACGHPPNTLPCDDALFCTGADVCSGGACTHAGDPCVGGAECADVCEETSTSCVTPAGTPCTDDDIACTADECQSGRCEHPPVDALCDQGECVLGVCSPSAATADRRGCIATPVAEGEQCTDDGFTCTDDTCNGGSCLHVPIASRCVPPGDCTSAVCEPGGSADTAGCLPGPALEEGQECAEDGEPCTDDVCRIGLCAHDDVPDTITCEPVTRAFRQALALEGLARRLMSNVGDAFEPSTTPQAVVTEGSMVDRLTPVTQSLEAVSRTLAGKSDLPTEGRARGVPKTLAQLRAGVALEQLARKPGEVRGFLRLVGTAKRKKLVQRDAARTLKASGRLVLERMAKLKRELRRLRRVSQTFVP